MLHRGKVMEKNLLLKTYLHNLLNDNFRYTDEYDKLFTDMLEFEQTFKAKIESDKEILKQYLQLESMRNSVHLEFEDMLFCEGLRIGFKLCMDIFEL